MKKLVDHINESLFGAITIVTLFGVFALYSTADLFFIAKHDKSLFEIIKMIPGNIMKYIREPKNQEIVSLIVGDLVDDKDIQEYVKNPRKKGLIKCIDKKITPEQRKQLKNLDIEL